MIAVYVGCVSTSMGCQSAQSAAGNSKMAVAKGSSGNQDQNGETAVNSNAVRKAASVYDCDLTADRQKFSGSTEIVVGDNLYATQINDWYMRFDQYEGKTVEIEGYYIGDFAPYDFIGRYGPSCPYCQGGYVCFEILTDVDVSQLNSGKDWIKVKVY